jgi:hypothetical protein
MTSMTQFGGPIREPGNCGCEDQKGRRPVTVGPSLVPTFDTCGPEPASGDPQLPGNEPVEDDAYRCALGVRLQPAVDRARRLSHTFGVRPYRVFLVWQERDRYRIWRERCRLELIPVRLEGLSGVDLTLAEAGLNPEGIITLHEVSPSQVTEDDLRGFLDGALWGKDTVDREFFYEVRLHERCIGRGPGGTKRRRFILGAEPEYKGDDLQWEVGLVDQEIARDRSDRDRSLDPERRPPSIQGPTLVP